MRCRSLYIIMRCISKYVPHDLHCLIIYCAGHYILLWDAYSGIYLMTFTVCFCWGDGIGHCMLLWDVCHYILLWDVGPCILLWVYRGMYRMTCTVYFSRARSAHLVCIRCIYVAAYVYIYVYVPHELHRCMYHMSYLMRYVCVCTSWAT